ncbi:uncharacterized protein SPSK_02102 [Sporothrix schenckii 1099-18]|uniref:Uncharacterized protein n=1 Tax=Sporothrix schenckii 1099-18 TaxID=1397361 RepID=A0A0F2MBI7_SPOSC|nr:uncharacterized protein SPSK_02102 [Sporothrix schenckii 1099-18]KJR86992.1 hypothetical protein SPSK_02102 [Sporothrix schenckii 1099-18]
MASERIESAAFSKATRSETVSKTRAVVDVDGRWLETRTTEGWRAQGLERKEKSRKGDAGRARQCRRSKGDEEDTIDDK